jgi:pSer/pThr/pTyr-binding forkhead associated (FHA) protein
MRATLLPLDGGTPIGLVKDITVIGRQDFCDVQLSHASISKVHLVIVKTDGLLLFRDLGSTNGTKVNGQRVIRGALLPNDKLTIAGCKFRVQMLPDEEKVAESDTQQVPPKAADPPLVRVIRAKDLAKGAPAAAPPIGVEAQEGGLLETDRESGSENSPELDGVDGATPPRVDPENDDGAAPPLFLD